MAATTADRRENQAAPPRPARALARRTGGPAHQLNAVYAMWLREFKVFQREKSRVFSSMAQPVLWILLIGTGFGATTEFKAADLKGLDYREFMFPGVIAMSILFQTMFFGLYIVWDRKLDVLKEVLVAPVSRTAVFFGKVLGGSTEAFAQATILFVVGALFFGVTWQQALAAYPFAILLALAFTSLGLFIGSFFESLEGFQVIASFIMFPLFFLSGALYPLEGLPAWLHAITRANPVTYAVDGLRGSLIGVHEFAYATDLAVLAAFTAVLVVAGTWGFSRMK